MLLDGDVLYGVTHRGTVTGGDFRAMITATRLAPDWESGAVLGELTDERWSFPTTIANVGGELLVVNSQFHAQRLNIPPVLPFTVAASEFPSWPESAHGALRSCQCCACLLASGRCLPGRSGRCDNEPKRAW
jgi:hypothetical protein